MTSSGYIFGGSSGLSYDQLQQRRKLVDQLQKGGPQNPQTAIQGLSKAAGDMSAAFINRGLDRRKAQLDLNRTVNTVSRWGRMGGAFGVGK